MLDIGWSEMAVIALLALIIIGPKDLPKVMRTIGQWTRKARSVAREFQAGLDDMIRESELDEARKTVERSTRLDVGSEIEKSIDPSASLREEAADLERTARSDGAGGNSDDTAAKSSTAKSSATKSSAAKSNAAKSSATKSNAAKSNAAKSNAAKSQERKGARQAKQKSPKAPGNSVKAGKSKAGKNDSGKAKPVSQPAGDDSSRDA